MASSLKYCFYKNFPGFINNYDGVVLWKFINLVVSNSIIEKRSFYTTKYNEL